MDLGTGDGRAAVALAVAEPGSFVLGVDPVASAMAESSRRAAGRDGPRNVVFLAASAVEVANVLPGAADVVRVNFPWGSLLHGVLGLDDAVVAALRALLRPGGEIVALVSVTPRDGVAGVPALDGETLRGVAARRARCGLALAEAREALPEEIRATRSTWGRRLLSGHERRPVWRLELRGAAAAGSR